MQCSTHALRPFPSTATGTDYRCRAQRRAAQRSALTRVQCTGRGQLMQSSASPLASRRVAHSIRQQSRRRRSVPGVGPPQDDRHVALLWLQFCSAPLSNARIQYIDRIESNIECVQFRLQFVCANSCCTVPVSTARDWRLVYRLLYCVHLHRQTDTRTQFVCDGFLIRTYSIFFAFTLCSTQHYSALLIFIW